MIAMGASSLQAQANKENASPSHKSSPSRLTNLSNQTENLGNLDSPHFMTPTFASKLAEVEKLKNRAPPPVTVFPIKADGGKTLLKSAAKRVGFHRTGDGTLRSKKEGNSKSKKSWGISFHDQPSTTSWSKPSEQPQPAPSNETTSGPPPTPPKDTLTRPPPTPSKDTPIGPPPIPSERPPKVANTSPKGKPLPPPPPAPLDMSTPFTSAVSLIEATEKPLRGFSDDPMEEWPVLQPERANAPVTIQDILRETGHGLKQQRVSSHGERYPKLAKATQETSEIAQTLVSRYSSIYQIPRNEVSSADDRASSNISRDARANKGLSDPFADPEEDQNLVANSHGMKTSEPSLSAAAAAVEKYAKESKGNPTPRQTRTSSLRARRSAGSIEKHEEGKVLGFTDFTALRASNESLAAPSRRDSYRARKEAQARGSSDPVKSVLTKQSAPSLRTKQPAFSTHSNKSTESIGKGRAPAQFVGGSRRPIPPPRPGSRGSNRNLSQGSISAVASRPSSRSSQTAPLPERRPAMSGGAYPIIPRQVQPRKSSIPLPSHITTNATVKTKDDAFSTTSNPAQIPAVKGHFVQKMAPRNELNGIYGNRPSKELMNTVKGLDAEGVGSFKNSGSHQILKGAQESRSLQAIEESPQHLYRTKRLSSKVSDYGPSLKISPSAERFIMGTYAKTNSNQENRPIHDSPFEARSDRPLSSDGMLQSSPRHTLSDPSPRQKKAKSADLSSSLSMNFHPNPGRKDPDDSKASSDNGPFRDKPRGSTASHPEAPEMQVDDTKVINEMDWISPVASKTEDALAAVEKAKSPSHVLKKSQEAKNSETTPKQAPRINPMKNFKVDTKDLSELAGRAKAHITKQQPFTPIQGRGTIPSSSGRYPPRSSSRVAQPESIQATPATAEKKGPHDLPNDYQNNFGSVEGQVFSQTDRNQVAAGFGHDSTARDSVARDSVGHQSHASVSKTVLSSFRGLFHNKHPSTHETIMSASKREPVKSSTRKTKDKVSITASGSPFPSTGNTNNAISRPTLASANRATASRNTMSESPLHPTRPAPPTPALTSPAPTHLSTSTNLVMQLLDEARHEPSTPKKNQMLKMGEMMVDALTQARNAEKAMEEAKEAARHAEMASACCDKAVGEVGRMVAEWKRMQRRDTA